MNPFEQLADANDKYHAAVNKIIKDSDTIEDVNVRCQFADAARCAFSSMQTASDLIKSYYVQE